MRAKVIARCKVLLQEQGDIGSEDFLSFPQPTTPQEIDVLTDEQLIELLETNGMFEG